MDCIQNVPNKASIVEKIMVLSPTEKATTELAHKPLCLRQESFKPCP